MKPRIAGNPVRPIDSSPLAPDTASAEPRLVQVNRAMNWPSMNASTMKADMSLMPERHHLRYVGRLPQRPADEAVDQRRHEEQHEDDEHRRVQQR